MAMAIRTAPTALRVFSTPTSPRLHTLLLVLLRMLQGLQHAL